MKKAAELAKSNIISKNVLEELEEEEPPSLLGQNPNVYLCFNFKFIKFMCGRHESLNEPMKWLRKFLHHVCSLI